MGNHAVQRLLRAKLLQPKLTVSEPGDVFEREADDVAETVMRMPQTAADERSLSPRPNLLRASDDTGPAPEVSGDLESSVLAQTTGGQPLAPAARAFFEPRLNSDLGNVRIHADSQAAESARSVDARAYTLGNHIVFGNAEYAPDSHAGRKLLAHELVHVIQQGGSSQAVQRKVDFADPDTQTASAQPVPAPTTALATSPPASTSLANSGRTVFTNWFVDFSGVANNGRKKGRGDRDPGDVLILEDFTVGPKDNPKTFPKAGDAQKAGNSRLGTYDHPKGPGSAFGTVSYASRRELDIKLTWDGQKRRETNPAAFAAARQTVEKLIFRQSDVSGDWNEVESRAAEAAEKFPGVINPKVEIQWRGNHQEYSLNRYDYIVQNPSLCTAQISVPTTSSAVDWFVDNSKQHVQHNDTHTAEQSHVDTDVQTANADSSDHSNSSQDATKEHDKDTSDEHHAKQTHTYTDYQITLEDLEQSSKQVYAGMSESLRISWAKILKKLELERGDKAVPQEEEEKDLSWGDKVKKWFKDRGKDVIDLVKNKLYGKVKGWVSGKIKGYLKKLLFVGLEVEAWWFPLLGWGVDWAVGKLGDKIRGKLEAHKGQDARDAQQPPPANSNYVVNETTLTQLYDYVSEILTSSNTSTDTEKDIKESFRSVYESYEQTSSNKSHEHSKDSINTKAKADATSEAHATQVRVGTSADHQDSADSGEGDLISTRRASHGTTIKITAGQPLLKIEVEEKP